MYAILLQKSVQISVLLVELANKKQSDRGEGLTIRRFNRKECRGGEGLLVYCKAHCGYGSHCA